MIGSLDTVQAGGTFGESVIKHLLAANFIVTALTRVTLKIGNSFPSAVKVVKTNYDSVESLVTPLDGQDAIVYLINRNQ
jgi:putative NADH-flavin reductase